MYFFTGKILALVRFHPQLEPEYALRHELSTGSAITFTFVLEEATDFMPRGDGSLLRADPASPAYNRHYLTLPAGSRRALTEQDALQGEGVRGGISPRWKSFNVK